MDWWLLRESIITPVYSYMLNTKSTLPWEATCVYIYMWYWFNINCIGSISITRCPPVNQHTGSILVAIRSSNYIGHQNHVESPEGITFYPLIDIYIYMQYPKKENLPSHHFYWYLRCFVSIFWNGFKWTILESFGYWFSHIYLCIYIYMCTHTHIYIYICEYTHTG